MLFIRQATTPGMRAACFPADDTPDPASLARASGLGRALGLGRTAESAGADPREVAGAGGSVVWVAPVRAAVGTACAMGAVPRQAPELAEADFGRWRGLPYEQVAREEPDALASWLSDPDAAPHGGESLAALAARVAAWLDSMRAEPHVVAVCDAGAIRAALGHALGLDPPATARFDLAPLSTTELTVSRGGWRVAHVNRKVAS